MDELITIGKIGKNQGNKGEVRVVPLTDFPERFDLLQQVYLEGKNRIIDKKIESVRYHKNFIIVKFADVDNIEQTLQLKDMLVKITEEELMPLPEGEYYIHDLLGFTVQTDAGQKLGRLADVITTGGVDIFVVRGGEKDYMLPASKEIIIEINENDEKIIVEPIPGLLDL